MTDKDREFYFVVWRCMIALIKAFAKWQGFYIAIETQRKNKNVL